MSSYQHTDFVQDVGMPWNLASAVKYVTRLNKKGCAEIDLKKALHYLELEETRLERDKERCKDLLEKYAVANDLDSGQKAVIAHLILKCRDPGRAIARYLLEDMV